MKRALYLLLLLLCAISISAQVDLWGQYGYNEYGWQNRLDTSYGFLPLNNTFNLNLNPAGGVGGQPLVADIDNDGEAEIVYPTSTGFINVYNGEFTLQAQNSVPVMQGQPIFIDADLNLTSSGLPTVLTHNASAFFFWQYVNGTTAMNLLTTINTSVDLKGNLRCWKNTATDILHCMTVYDGGIIDVQIDTATDYTGISIETTAKSEMSGLSSTQTGSVGDLDNDGDMDIAFWTIDSESYAVYDIATKSKITNNTVSGVLRFNEYYPIIENYDGFGGEIYVPIHSSSGRSSRIGCYDSSNVVCTGVSACSVTVRSNDIYTVSNIIHANIQGNELICIECYQRSETGGGIIETRGGVYCGDGGNGNTYSISNFHSDFTGNPGALPTETTRWSSVEFLTGGDFDNDANDDFILPRGTATFDVVSFDNNWTTVASTGEDFRYGIPVDLDADSYLDLLGMRPNGLRTWTSDSNVCGNNLKQIGEQCDGTDLGGASCVSLGYASGTLFCSGSCTYNTASCVANSSGGAGGGGGSSTPPVEDTTPPTTTQNETQDSFLDSIRDFFSPEEIQKVACDIVVNPTELTLTGTRRLVGVNVQNNEQLTYSPNFIFSGDYSNRINVANTVTDIAIGKSEDVGIIYAGSVLDRNSMISSTLTLTLVDARCEDVQVPITLDIQQQPSLLNVLLNYLTLPVVSRFSSFKGWMLVGLMALVSFVLPNLKAVRGKKKRKKTSIGIIVVLGFLLTVVLTGLITTIMRFIF